MEDMAEQAARLQVIKDTRPHGDFDRTPEQLALLAHREIRKEFFADRDAEYAEIYQEEYDALSENGGHCKCLVMLFQQNVRHASRAR